MKIISGLKVLINSAILLISVSSMANTNLGTFSERLRISTEKVAQIEKQLTAEDVRHMEYLVGHLEDLLKNYTNEPEKSFLCVSNGDNGSWEKFGVYSTFDSKVIGGYTSKLICQEIVKKVTFGLICLSNGENGSFEKFTPYDIQGKVFMGGATSLVSCFEVLKTSKSSMICLSNGENGSFEKFTIYDRLNKKYIGSQTSKENCLENLK